jgi:hypothetical protein
MRIQSFARPRRGSLSPRAHGLLPNVGFGQIKVLESLVQFRYGGKQVKFAWGLQ